MKSRNVMLGGLSLGLLMSLGAWANWTPEGDCDGPPRDSSMECPAMGGVDELAASEDMWMEPAAPVRISEGKNTAAGRSEAEAPERTISADEASAVLAAALAEAQGVAESNAARRRALMTRTERDAFRLAVQGCWQVDPGSPAGRTAVTVAFDLDPEGQVNEEMELLMHDASSEEVARQAFEAARRAILRCQDDVVPLPVEDYGHERHAEMTFDARTWAIR